MYSIRQIESTVKSKGYVWFEDKANKGFDVNIVSVRNMASGNLVTNVFDDTITISYKEKGIWQYKSYPCTTEAGKKGVQHFHNPKGVAILQPSQNRGSHSIALHQGKYKALCQRKPLKIWRDDNKDLSYDHNVVDEGVFGINIHRSNPITQSEFVENWSEGCTVFKKASDFDEFMLICEEASAIHGNSFTYTLLVSSDVLNTI